MLSDKIVPAHIIAGYVWDAWQANSGVDSITLPDGKTLARLAPLQDEPMLADSGETYMIYGFSESEEGNLPQLRTGIVSFRIIGREFSELTQAVRLLTDLFEVGDDAAHSVNLWSSMKAPMIGIRFTTISASYVESADAATTEGGRMETMVNLRYRYVINSSVKKWNGTTWNP